MRRPSINTAPGDAFAAIGERIVEVSFNLPGSPGCLISLAVKDGRPTIEVYRSDPGIVVVAPERRTAADPAELGEHRCDPLCPGWFVDAESGKATRCDDCWRHAPESFDDDDAARAFAAAAMRLPFADVRDRAHLERVACRAPLASAVRAELALCDWITAEPPHEITQAGREAFMLGACNDRRDEAPEPELPEGRR